MPTTSPVSPEAKKGGVLADTRGFSPRPADFLAKLPTTLRPRRNLLNYYILSSILLGPAFFVMLVPLCFRYLTLRYDIDEEGLRMRWGILFRREVSLTYARIQDIHLTSNFVERWLGLGKIQVQTASGNAVAEMTIEGVQELEELRDFLYIRMRGARDAKQALPGAPAAPGRSLESQELARALEGAAEELRRVRELLQQRFNGNG